MELDGFEVYKKYVALKNHFSSENYDYFKYNGRTKVSRKKFEERNDRFFFNKLAKEKDVETFLVANIVYNNNNWIGDLVNNSESERIYKNYLKVRESITYVFKNDLEALEGNFINNFKVVGGQHPIALQKYLKKEIHLETLIILNDILAFSGMWNKKIEESLIWPSIYNKCKKLKPFIKYDRSKIKDLVVDKIKGLI